MECSTTIWWWSDPSSQWFSKILDHIKLSDTSSNDIILLHCENVAGFENSIPLMNYFYNLYVMLNSLDEERIMFLNLKDMVSLIELHLTRQEKENKLLYMDIEDKEIMHFYDEYIKSYKEKNDSEDGSITIFKEFLKQNNCIDVNILLDFYLECDQSKIYNHIEGHTYLILGTPSSSFLKQFICILSGEKLNSIYVETPLDVSLHGSQSNQISEKVKVSHDLIETKEIVVQSEELSSCGSATVEYVEDIILSFLSLLINSKNELALSKAMISPVINLSHEAFTALKRLSLEKDMPMCQVAVSYVTRIKLGGKGYAPSADCPMLQHLKKLELFVEILNQLQTIIEEDFCPRSAIKKLINVLKKKLLKYGSEKLKNISVEAVAENLQSILLSVSEILKSRISTNASQICQGTLDVLFHFINFISSNSFIFNPDTILSKKRAERTPLNLPPLLGYFRSPDEESTCDSKLTLNEDSALSKNSVIKSVQSTAFSYFHHSESSGVSASCVNSSTPSRTTFKDCLDESAETPKNQKKIKVSEIYSENSHDEILPPKQRKRCILSEITNKNNSTKDKSENLIYNTSQKCMKTSEKSIKENATGSNGKKQSKKEPKRGAKKFKQIQGQGKITSFFLTGKAN